MWFYLVQKGWSWDNTGILEIPENTWGYLKSLLIRLDETLWLILQMYSNVKSSPLSPVWSKLWALDIWTYQECDSLQKVLCSPEGRGMHTKLWNVHDDWFPMNSNWIESLYHTLSIYLSDPICLSSNSKLTTHCIDAQHPHDRLQVRRSHMRLYQQAGPVG